MVGALAPDAAAFGHRHHGGFIGIGLGFPGCCFYGPPYAYYPPGPAYGYPPPAYAAPAPSYAQPAPIAAYAPPAAAPSAPPISTGDCREFQTTISIGGQPQRAYGFTCRQPDGSWRMVQGPAPSAAR